MRSQFFGASQQDARDHLSHGPIDELLDARSDRPVHERLRHPQQFILARFRMVIAVVDHNRELLVVLARLLSGCGYRSECFASAGEFLSAEVKSKAACLVVDIELGDISGLELVRQLFVGGFKLPVIFMSGAVSEAYRRAALDLGCVAYLRKPFPPSLLIAAIEQAVGSSLHLG